MWHGCRAGPNFVIWTWYLEVTPPQAVNRRVLEFVPVYTVPRTPFTYEEGHFGQARQRSNRGCQATQTYGQP